MDSKRLRLYSTKRLLPLTLSLLMLFLLIAPVIALLWRALGQGGLSGALETAPIMMALLLSLSTTAASMVGVVLLGTPLAYAFARYTFPFKRVLAVFIELPIVMPPVVAGLALLAAFGRRGLVGQSLAEWGLMITFNWTAVSLAQLFVAAPFYIRAAQARFSTIPADLAQAAGIDGADEWQLFWHIIRPLSQRALLAGLLLSWARALGEFGATILFAGNLPGRTQTMPLLVYGALERDINAAFVTALLLLGLAGSALFATRWLARLDEGEADPLA